MSNDTPLARSRTAAADGDRVRSAFSAPPARSAPARSISLKRQRGRYRVEAVTAHRNVAALAALARKVGARFAAIADPIAASRSEGCARGHRESRPAPATRRVVEAASRPADWVMAAITGATGLRPTLAAAERGAMVALANKECLVCAGGLFMRRAAAKGATILPVDSEHNALFQAMSAGRRDEVRRVILTASGGPFRTASVETIRAATPQQALKHPNWSMGAKVTIDSATLMNKGLELIEAHHLFSMPSRADRYSGASAIDRAWDGRVPGRFDHRAARAARHARADRPLPGLAGAARRARPPDWIGRKSQICRSRRPITRGSPRSRSRARRWRRAARRRPCSMRRTRSRSRNFSPDASDLPPFRRSWRPLLMRRPAAACRKSRRVSKMHFPLTMFPDRWPRVSCPKSA